jgi:hypothetical protein
MLSDFLNETCTITRETTTNDNGIVKRGNETVYSNIPCYSYAYRGNLPATNLSQNTSTELRKCIIEPNKILVKRGDFVTLGSKYQVILDPKANYLID